MPRYIPPLEGSNRNVLEDIWDDMPPREKAFTIIYGISLLCGGLNLYNDTVQVGITFAYAGAMLLSIWERNPKPDTLDDDIDLEM